MNIDILRRRVIDDYLEKAGDITGIRTPDELALYILRYGHRYPSLLLQAVESIWGEQIDHYDDVVFFLAQQYGNDYIANLDQVVYDYRNVDGLIDTYRYLIHEAAASTIMFGYYFYINSAQVILTSPLDFYEFMKKQVEARFWDFKPNMTVFDLITYSFFARAVNMGSAILQGSNIAISVLEKFLLRVKEQFKEVVNGIQ